MSRPKPPMPDAMSRRWRKQTRPYAFHVRNPAGSKLARRAKERRL